MKINSRIRKVLSIAMVAAMIIPANIYRSNAQTLSGWLNDDQLTNKVVSEPKDFAPLPDKMQYEYQKQELAAFCHFGPNTFNEIEWGESYGNTPPAEIFKLGADDNFDADTLVETLKNAGFKRLIVTAKHHDGFCIWDSQYTDYDVANTNYKNGKGDILAEISAACTKFNMDMGLYLSPWDIHDKSYGYFDKNGNALVGSDGQPLNGMSWEEVEEKDVYDYNEYYNNQLEEILGNDKYGNNGEFVEVWMDGAKGSGYKTQNYKFNNWFDTIQTNEGIAAGRKGDCLLFGSGARTTVRWIGNELGFAPETNWAQAKLIYNNGVATDVDTGWSESTGFAAGYPDGDVWTVPECDARITSGWFWGNSKKTPKTMDELSEMYFRSVGHNGTLLLNVPPNNQGKLDTAIQERIVEFGNAVKNTFKTNKASNKEVYANSVLGDSKSYSPNNVIDANQDTYWAPDETQNKGSLLVDLGEKTKFDVVSIEEAIQKGQKINKYKVEYSNDLTTWETMDEGTTVGSKRLCRTNTIDARYVKITVETETGATPLITEVGVYKATGGLELNSTVPEGMTVVDNTDKDTSDGFGFTYSGWTQETGNKFINGTSMWANAGADLTVKFHGTKGYLMGTLDPNHGKATISIDGGTATQIDTTATNRSVGNVLFETTDLTDGDHTLTLHVDTKAIGIEGLLVIDNGGKGMFEFEKSQYRVLEAENENATLEHKITVKRVGGSNGEATVQVENNPGTAMQGNYDATNSGGTLTFGDGETSKEVSLYTKYDSRIQGDTAFTMNLVNSTNDTIIGFKKIATITITDRDVKTKDELNNLINEAEKLNTQEYLYVSGWNNLQVNLELAKAIIAKSDATVTQIGLSYRNLTIAINSLVVRTKYTQDDPFVMPFKQGQTAILEAEFAELINSGGDNEEWKLGIEERDWASNGKIVNCFEVDDKLEIPYIATKTGTYKVVLTYRSGGVNNGFTVTEKNSKVDSVTVAAGNDDASVTLTKEFEINVTKTGAGTLVLTAGANKGPQLDKFEITPKDLSWEKYTITAAAGKGGTISPVGEKEYTEFSNATYTITPNDGYEIDEVKINGASQGAITSYTFENIKAGSKIEVTFKFKYYSLSEPFTLPETIGEENAKVLEAELTELTNTGPADEAWKLEIAQASWASGGKFVNSLNNGDKMTIHYNASKAGLYQFTATYRSGSSTNKLVWAGDKVEAGEIAAGNSDSSVTKTVTFTITITEAGIGSIVFTAPSSNSPQLDKFDIVYFGDDLTQAKMDLAMVITQANTILENINDYTQPTADAFKIALTNAKNAYNSDAITSEELKRNKSALETAMASLVKKADKTELKNYIDQVQAIIDELYKYSPNSVLGLEENLANANKLYQDDSVKQNEIDAMVRTLKNSLDNVKLKADIEDLQKAVEEAKKIDLDGYTPASINVFNLVLNDAQALLTEDLDFNDQANVDKMHDRLNKAIKLLTKIADLEEAPIDPDKPVDPDQPVVPDQPVNPDKPTIGGVTEKPADANKPAKTGDNANYSLLVMLSLFSVVGGAFLLKRKKIED